MRVLRITGITITPDLVIRSAPVLDPTAFLQASFVQGGDAPPLPGKVSIYRDGMFVGRSMITPAARDETVRVPAGSWPSQMGARVSVARVRNDGQTNGISVIFLTQLASSSL